MLSCSADGTSKLWETFGSNYEIYDGKLLETYSQLQNDGFRYDVPTCVSWMDDYFVRI